MRFKMTTSTSSPHERPQQLARFPQTLIEVHHRRLNNLLPAEHEQLSGQSCAPVRGLANIIEVLWRPGLRSNPRFKQLDRML